jgi:shikimate kinase
MNVVLIGYRCAGKTVVGTVIAEQMGWDLVDTDAMIEMSVKRPIEAIINDKGWNHFRWIEKGIIEKISGQDKQVISTGGGVVLDEDNVRRLRKNGWIVWLKADAETVRKRMAHDQGKGNMRPSLTGTDPIYEIEEILKTRTPLYEKACDFMVDTSIDSIRGIADTIMEEFSRVKVK